MMTKKYSVLWSEKPKREGSFLLIHSGLSFEVFVEMTPSGMAFREKGQPWQYSVESVKDGQWHEMLKKYERNQ